MDSSTVSKLFASETIIVGYKGKTLGGTGAMPQWEIEPVINENRYFRPNDGVLAKLTVSSSISLEFEALNPQHPDKSGVLYFPYDFDNTPGELTFLPLNPGNRTAYYFPLAELKNRPEMIRDNRVRWKFEIFSDANGVFMEKVLANN
ncbi:MAG: hypothetical protein PHH77_00600 [Victivallaceae bacterium]|nr:hypothetical protein [Victivallaceae bacterium]